MRINIIHDTNKPDFLGLTKTVEMVLPHSGRVVIHAAPDMIYWWNGNSTPPLPIMRYLVPKWFFLVASLFHDFLCERAITKEDRKKADKDYKWILETYYRQKVSNIVGYLGVRIGALIGHKDKK